MVSIPIDLSEEAYQKLKDEAERERREPSKQAEVFVLEALKLWPVKSASKAGAKDPLKPKIAQTNHAPATQP